MYNSMKNILTLLYIFLTFGSISQIDSTWVDFVELKTTPFSIATHGDASKLYVKHNNSKKKKRIKKGATAQIKTHLDSVDFLCKILIFNDSGIYVSPYERKTRIESEQELTYKAEYQLLDSVSFIKYSQIKHFSYSNNLEKKYNSNVISLAIGTVMLISPPIVNLMNEDEGVKLLNEPIFLIEMGIGAILTTYSIYKLKRDILKQIDLSEFSFRYTLQ